MTPRLSDVVVAAMLALAACSPVCKEDPVASGQVKVVTFESSGSCTVGLGRRELITSHEEWDDFKRACIGGLQGADYEEPHINFRTHEVVVSTTSVDCASFPVVESSTCADGVLSVTMSYEADWCYCDTMSSVPIAVIARKGLITDIDGAWVDRSVCEDTTCDCGGSVVSGCQGCPAP